MRAAIPLSILLALTPTYSGEQPRQILGERAEMRAKRVALFPADPSRQTMGSLVYLGGVRLTSPDPAFGGFSSMRIEGDRFTMLSDGGNVVRFRMGADWQPREVAFADLPGPGTGWLKQTRDSESMAFDPATGRTWVGFERLNAIWRFDRDLTRAEERARPAAMAGWPKAGGPEAMTRLRDGSFVVFSESSRPKGKRYAREGLRYAGDPTVMGAIPTGFAFVPPAGYDPTDVAELPDGRLLVLTRRFSIPALFTAKLVLVDLRNVPTNGLVRGRELASFERPSQHDNFEALAITREGGATIVWIASDDNSEVWEDSLLLKFRLNL